MNTLDFYRVECPKCHGQLNSVAPLSGQTLCPFCGTVYHITANMNKEAEMPERIVPFTTLIGDFEYSAKKMLVSEDFAPVNIARLISFEGAKGVYLPVYFYEGKYESTWSCKIKQKPADTDIEKNPKEVYRPQNGVSKGKYSMICAAYEGVELDKELADYIRSLDFWEKGIRPFQPKYLNNCLFLARNRDERQIWELWGEDSLSNIVRTNIMMQMQDNDVKNFKCDITSGGTSKGKFIFYPVWMLNYQYDGKLHHIFMDGTGRNGVRGTTPIDRALKAKADKPFKILVFIAVAAVIIPFLILLAGWYKAAIIALFAMGLLFFGYKTFVRWYISRLMNKARFERIKEFTFEALKSEK